MAARVLRTTGEPPAMRRHWLMVDAVVATDDGNWFDVGPFSKGMEIRFTGITTATLQIRGSSAAAQPDDSDDQAQIGSDVTANGTVDVTSPPRWLKIKTSAWTTGTISVFMVAST